LTVVAANEPYGFVAAPDARSFPVLRRGPATVAGEP
jgi:hypothetical protein